MKKIPSLFKRDYDGNRQIINEYVPEASWINEPGVKATVKFDGTCCLVQDGQIYKRYDAKHGKTAPAGFIPAQEKDEVTGHQPGWILCDRTKPEDKYFFEGFDEQVVLDGTYELVGPKVQGNPEKADKHKLLKHASVVLEDVPTTFDELKIYLDPLDIEGVVWHHPDGRMCKVKKKDYGMKREPTPATV